MSMGLAILQEGNKTLYSLCAADRTVGELAHLNIMHM